MNCQLVNTKYLFYFSWIFFWNWSPLGWSWIGSRFLTLVPLAGSPPHLFITPPLAPGIASPQPCSGRAWFNCFTISISRWGTSHMCHHCSPQNPREGLVSGGCSSYLRCSSPFPASEKLPHTCAVPGLRGPLTKSLQACMTKVFVCLVFIFFY